jgi:hypothetical protein
MAALETDIAVLSGVVSEVKLFCGKSYGGSEVEQLKKQIASQWQKR